MDGMARLIYPRPSWIAMLTRDIIAARAAELPGDLPGEEVYERLFAAKDILDLDPYDRINQRRAAFAQGRLMVRATIPKAELKKLRVYMDWLKKGDILEDEE